MVLEDCTSECQFTFVGYRQILDRGGKRGEFSMMVNGRPWGEFKACRGLRQDYRLSPFLLVLCADALDILLKRATKIDVCKGMKVGRENIEISHLQFANDTILFSNGNE